MKRSIYRSISILSVCVMSASFAFASSLLALHSTAQKDSDPISFVPFPAAGDVYFSATNGGGVIPVGGQTAFQWTAGDWVLSPVFAVPTNSVTDLSANWSFQDYLATGSNEDWYVYVNGVAVAQAVLPGDNYSGAYLTVTGTVDFADIAPVAGGYQVELILQNTIPGGDGSVAWADGGVTGLSYSNVTPEPGSLLLMGSGMLALAGSLRRRYLSRK